MLDQLLSTLDVSIEAFGTCEACPDWRLILGSFDEPSVHYVLNGAGLLHLPGQESIEMSRNDLVLLPKGLAHTFDNGFGRRVHEYQPEPVEGEGGARLATIRAGAPVEGRACLIVACGTIRAAFGGVAGLFDQLDVPILERFDDQFLAGRFEGVLNELRTPTIGTRALTEAYLKQAVLLLLRRQLRHPERSPSWLSPFSDKDLAPAMLAILERPHETFKLDELASMAGVDRDEFTRRFALALGCPPIEFLKHVRLHRAAKLLAVTDLPTKIIATSVGYESRSYFSRIFRESYGVSPFAYRATQRLKILNASGVRPG